MAWLGARRRARRWNHAQGWEYAGLAEEGSALDRWPVNFWACRWVPLGHNVILREPARGNRVSAACFFVEHDGRRTGFASTEISEGACLFFLPIE